MIVLIIAAAIAVIYMSSRVETQPVERKVRVRDEKRPQRSFDIIDD
ncbi:MAG: hypothetical protein AAFN27_09025 [Pseudomonadota bacterium]